MVLFVSQELLIQQLEDEISQLRKQERGEFSTDITSHNATKHTGNSVHTGRDPCLRKVNASIESDLFECTGCF